MGLTSGTRVTAATAAVVMLGGLAVALHGLWRNQPSYSLIGVALIMVALAAIVLAVLHRWIADTSSERATLADATRATQMEHARYVTAQAALENEHARLMQDVAAERAALEARLMAERAAMQERFELATAEVSTDAMKLLASWVRGGKVRPPSPQQQGTILRFPAQDQPEPVRSRERGVAGP